MAGPDMVSFRVWAPARKRVRVIIAPDGNSAEFELGAERDGYFSGTRAHTTPGTLYLIRLDDDARVYPDPASRFQPHGHDGPSEIIDPQRYSWNDRAWRGVHRHGQVIYEM